MTWRPMTDVDAEILAATRQKLRGNDLLALCNPQGWMSDSLIDYGVTVCPAGEAGFPLGNLTRGVFWLQPTLVTLGTGDARDFEDTLGGRGALGGFPAHLDKSGTLPKDASVLLFPVNRDNTHWSLLAFYKSDRTFVHYDSLTESNAEAAKKLIRRLFDKGYLSAELPMQVSPQVKPQDDSYNCGMFVILLARLHLETGGKPDGDSVARVDSAACDRFREVMLQSLGPLVADLNPQSMVAEPGAVPNSEQSRAEERQRMQEAIQKVDVQLEKEETGPIELAGMKPCPVSESGTVEVTLVSNDPQRRQSITSAKVIFTVGSEQFVRKAVRKGAEWVVEAQFQSLNAFDVDIKPVIEPAAGFDDAEQTATVQGVKAREHRQHIFTFTPKPERKLYARFMVEAEKGSRPFPPGFRVEFALDGGAEKVGAVVKEDGLCWGVEGHAGVNVPWRASRVGLAFPGSDKWQKLTWKADSDLKTAASFEEVPAPDKNEDPAAREWFLLPAHSWELQRNEWDVPKQHLGPGGEFLRQIDLSQQGALGTAQDPLVYVLKAGADPSKSFRMNGKVIDHVVVLMLENRGFDHLMGYLYEGAIKPKNNYPKNPVGQHAKLRPFEGLDGVQLVCPYDFKYRRRYGTGGLEPNTRHLRGEVPLKRGARSSNTPKINPHEDFIHIFQDMYGKDVVPDFNAMADPEKRNQAVKNPDGSYKKPEMNGWVQNYCDGILHHAGHDTFLKHELISQIMDMYLPDQLPVMSGLARNYAVSDLWFCSVPSQTNTNRAFWLTGSAAGLVKNDFYPAHPVKAGVLSPSEGLAADRLPKGGYDDMLHRRSLFDVLEENGVSWKYYWTLLWPPTIGAVWPKDLLPQFEADRFEANLPKIAQFEKDVAEQALPAVSYLEPLWGGGKIWDTMSPKTRFVGNEFHPVQDVTVGEFFVKKIYDTLFGDRPGSDGKRVANNPKRDSTVLMITFDENGGTFDHLAPWKASPTKREPPVTQYGFKFDCYGVRVPTLLISRYVPPETIFRSPTEVPFDHASILATILKWRGIPQRKWKLGDRVANAPTFDGVLEGDGSVEPERRKVATGMRAFDQQRAKIAKGQPIEYGDLFSLKFVGDRWAFEADVPGRGKPKLERQERLDLPDYLGGPDTWANYYYPIGSRDPGKALKLRFMPVDKDGKPAQGPVRAGRQALIEVMEGPAKGYTLAVPEVMGASSVYLYKGKNPSKWLPWIWNDRTEDEPLYYGDDVFLFSERYELERLKRSYYDPYQRLTIDRYQHGAPGLKRYARFRAGEWDIWRLEKAEPVSQEVRPVLSSERARAVLEGPEKKAAPVRFDLKLQFANPEAPKELQYFLTRSRPEVEVFLDEECKKALSFDGKNEAKLEKIAGDLKGGKIVPAWARPGDDQSFSLVFSAFKEKAGVGGPVAGPPSMLELGRAFTFLEGSSRWLQLVDSFQSTQEIKSSVNHIRSLAALADMGADELANFAIKRLFIRKGILDQPVVIRIDGAPVALKHPLTEGKLPLHYSDFVVDRSGPKFLGALDAEVAVEALMYKDACISSTLARLKQEKKAKAFDANLIQSVRDMAERRLARLQREKPQLYPEVSESETEAATSVFELKHMAQRKLSDFDLTARETHTLSRAIAAELTQLCGPDMPEPLVLEIGRIAWSRGGPIDPARINKAWVAAGNDGAKAAAHYAALCTGPEYTPKKEYKHGKYKGTRYYHILVDEVGPEACKLLEDSMPDVDAGYGLGIPYMGPQVEERGGKFERESNPKAEEHDRFEIGDIITDETSHYGTVFSHDLNVQNALARLKRAGVKWSFDDVNDFKRDRNLRDNVRALVARSGKADIAKEYFDREAFIDAVLMFEQVAKKEAQAQLFKATKNTGKLLGNVSDVGQFLLGVDIASRVAEANGNQVLKRKMEALKEVVQLSCLIAFPRWSVFARNLEAAKDTVAGIVKPEEEFAKSINERSYAHHKVPLGETDPDAPRTHVEWAGIDKEIARQRLADYSDGMKPVWAFLHQQKRHFENMDALIRVIQEDDRGDRGEARKAAARKAVREELARILPALPNLSAQLEGREQALLDALAQQAQESAQFQVTRAPDEKP